MSKAFESFLALEASAGSGKTFALSVRYVAIVLMGENINNILALTFTNKAAKEMKERIVGLFTGLDKIKNEKFIYESEVNELKKLLNISKTDDLIALKDKYLDDFLNSELRIGTFDSFFIKILRSFAPNVGLSPDFELCNDSDTSDEFLNTLSDDECKKLAKYLRGFNLSFTTFYERIKTYFTSGAKDFNHDILHKSNLQNALNNLKILVLNSDEKAFKSKYLQDALKKDYDDFSIFSASFLDESKKYVKNALDVPQFKNALDDLKKEMTNIAKSNFYKQISFIEKMLEVFLRSLDKQIKAKNLLSFSDTSYKVYQILQDERFKELLNFRLNMQIDHLLIDEFQDTNIVQFNILKPIASEILSGIGVKDKAKSLFYVGDKKQAIYRFRGGNSETFDAFRQDENGKFLEQIKPSSLDINYRSDRFIVDFVNDIFAPLYKDFGVDFKIAKAHKSENGCVKFIKSNEEERFVRCLEVVNELLKCNESLDDICILTRKNKTANELKFFLEQNNIKAVSKGGDDMLLVNEPSVRLLLEYAKWCVFKDKAYGEFVTRRVKGAKRLEIENFINYEVQNDESSQINDKFISIDDNASMVYLAMLKHLGIKTNKYLLEFISWASTKDDFLSTLFEECDLLLVDNAFGLRIMTVHSSKGLQFKNVIILDEKKSNKNANFFIDYSFSKNEFLPILTGLMFNFLAQNDKYFYDIFKEYEKKNALDKLNVAYVAATRAKNNLIFIYFDEKGSYDMLSLQNQENMGEFLQHQNQKIITSPPLKDIKLAKINQQKSNASSFAISDEIKVGLCFHYYMELSNLLEFDLKLFDFVCDEFRFYEKNLLQKVKNILINVFKNDEFLNLTHNAEIYKECEYVMGDGKRGRIDLLLIKNGIAYIIDYKTGEENSKYFNQLKEYENAVNIYLGKTIEISQTKTFILYALEEKAYLKALI